MYVDLMMACRNRLIHVACRALVVLYNKNVLLNRKVPFEVKVCCCTTKSRLFYVEMYVLVLSS